MSKIIATAECIKDWGNGYNFFSKGDLVDLTDGLTEKYAILFVGGIIDIDVEDGHWEIKLKKVTMENNEEQISDDWISVKERLPKDVGFYKIKTLYGEAVAPYTRTLRGTKTWVVPDENSITHWMPTEEK